MSWLKSNKKMVIGRFFVKNVLLNRIVIIFAVFSTSLWAIYLSYKTSDLASQISQTQISITLLATAESSFISKNDGMNLLTPLIKGNILVPNNTDYEKQLYQAYLNLKGWLIGIHPTQEYLDKESQKINSLQDYNKLADKNIVADANNLGQQLTSQFTNLSNIENADTQKVIIWQSFSTLLVAYLGMIELIKKYIDKNKISC